MTDDSQVETQTEEVEDVEKPELAPEALKAELARARADAAKYRVDAQRWRTHEDTQKTELEKAQAAAKDASDRLAATELRATRAEVAAKHGIPGDLVNSLAGSTAEEIEATAQALKKHLKASAVPDLKAGARGRPVNSDGKTDIDAFIRSAGRR